MDSAGGIMGLTPSAMESSSAHLSNISPSHSRVPALVYRSISGCDFFNG
ncbi:hypothetical protein BVRB_019160, partial [Beta vulgaris subsp. vulgaris]